MDKVFVVKRVAEKLWSTEDAIDAAIAETSQLMNELLEARKELKVSHLVIDGSTTKLAASMAALADARKAMMDAHHELYEAKLRIGVRMDTGIPSVPQHIEKEAKAKKAS